MAQKCEIEVSGSNEAGGLSCQVFVGEERPARMVFWCSAESIVRLANFLDAKITVGHVSDTQDRNYLYWYSNALGVQIADDGNWIYPEDFQDQSP